ncbi:NAD-dependent DNA ligase LigA [Polluticoccus soli]|uniref:NAD-dependent DNA ligase LigA n=1 Tax=Polluticoccus soli TaxID=3034150 RepID=UPI0023E2027D|nr:NAD-dependent DNA ligase LigA [Flavipsychrobacter sp. JY13-12]
MYTSQDEQRLYQQAKTLLTSESGNVEQDIEALREVINYADWKYYVQSEPVLADVEYDTLFKKLKGLEEQYPEQVTADSPTQRVALGLSEKFPAVSHLVPMLSLDNTYNADDLRDWDRRCRELAGTDQIEYCAEPKYDGASVSVIYEDGKLTRGATRGDGIMGEDVTVNIKQIRSMPLSAGFTKEGISQIEIRGEVVIHKDVFAEYNRQRAAEGLSPLANPRNAASGTLRILDPREVGKRKLSVTLYHISDYTLERGKDVPAKLHTHYDSLEYLYSLGFPTPVREMKRFSNIEDVIKFCDEFEQKRDDLPFEVDGLVIKVNQFDLQDRMGMTTHHPRWAVAYKFKARQATSKLQRVEFQVGRTGSVTPVAKIEPVPIGGVTVTSISLFNEDVVREKDLHIGDTVLVERAGDVIPYIVKPLAELRDGSEEKIVFPTHCPVCNEALERPEEEAVWRCININCPAQVVERIIHFASKDAMDIRNLGGANILKFYDLELLKDIPGIYHLDFDKIKQLEGFGEKSITNLRTAIDNSKKQPLNRVIFGLGIRHVGETMAKTLANAVNHIRELYDWDEEKLVSLEDVGPKVAASVAHFFHNPENRHMIDLLEKEGVNLESHHKSQRQAEGGLLGKTFLFTGTLSHFKRSDAEAMVEDKGGTLLSGVSSKLNYLVVGEDAGSKLEKAKKLGTVTILTETEFLELITK